MNDGERGEVKRVSFEILYPSGQLKQVHLPIGGVQRWDGAGLIVWSEHLVREVVAPGVAKLGAADAVSQWDTVDGQLKPAMLVVHDDGRVTQFCGAHHKIGGSALWPDEVAEGVPARSA
jgi:hypothetical protein